MDRGNESLFAGSRSQGQDVPPHPYMINALNFCFSRSDVPMVMRLVMQHWEHRPIIVYSDDVFGLTLTYLMTMSNSALYNFVWKKSKNNRFSGTIIDFVIKFASVGHSDKQDLLTSNLCPQGLLALPWGRGLIPSVVHTLQIASSWKSLGLLKPNCILSLHWNGVQKFVCVVWVTIPRWPPCPYIILYLFFFSGINEPTAR